MADLVEVVFERIEDSCIIKLFNSLIRSPDNVLTTQYPEDLKLFDNGSLIEGANSQLLSYSGDVIILVNIKILNIGDLELPYAQLRLIKYGHNFDIEFNFSYDDLENMTINLLMSSLHKNSKRIAKKYDMGNFFGGMEPATDEETRYFTNEIKGPLTY